MRTACENEDIMVEPPSGVPDLAEVLQAAEELQNLFTIGYRDKRTFPLMSPKPHRELVPIAGFRRLQAPDLTRQC